MQVVHEDFDNTIAALADSHTVFTAILKQLPRKAEALFSSCKDIGLAPFNQDGTERCRFFTIL